MPLQIHESFTDLTKEEFETFSSALVNTFPHGQKRKEAVAYLQGIMSKDKRTLSEERTTLRSKRRSRVQKQDSLDSLIESLQFDFNRTTDLFVQQNPSDADILQLLSEDNQEVYLKGRTFVGDLVISGDSILVDGLGNGKSAREEKLANTAIVTGDLIISGNDVVIRGIDFTSTTDQALRFTGTPENIVVEHCKFTAGANISDSTFWYGAGLRGNITLKNCLVEGFNSWMLMDAHTTSATPTLPLKRVRIKQNYFKNNYGSIAVRGMATNPTKLVSYTNNKFVSPVQHVSFWDFVEANNAIRIVVTGNEATGEVGNDTVPGKRGFLQTWSRSSIPWTLEYKDNTLTNLKVGGKIAHNTTFYAPDDESENFLIDLSSVHTNVAFAFSFIYKKNDGSTASADKWIVPQGGDYTPENIATYPTVPLVVNPNAYNVVVQ
jgi:hypothetical protein